MWLCHVSLKAKTKTCCCGYFLLLYGSGARSRIVAVTDWKILTFSPSRHPALFWAFFVLKQILIEIDIFHCDDNPIKFDHMESIFTSGGNCYVGFGS